MYQVGKKLITNKNSLSCFNLWSFTAINISYIGGAQQRDDVLHGDKLCTLLGILLIRTSVYEEGI